MRELTKETDDGRELTKETDDGKAPGGKRTLSIIFPSSINIVKLLTINWG